MDKKKTVNIRYCLGFERLVRAEIKNFEKLGLKPTIYRAAVNTINKRLNIKVGYYGANPNKQMDFDLLLWRCLVKCHLSLRLRARH